MKHWFAAALTVVFTITVSGQNSAANDAVKTTPSLSQAEHAVADEARRYVHDTKDLALAPFHWDSERWLKFGAGVGAVAVVYAFDKPIYDAVQRNRSGATNQFAEVITPFGANGAILVSALMVGTGVWRGDDQMRDAGRDALESEFIAGALVTPILKRTFGRARPNQNLGAHSFSPFTAHRESFPSGHATNAFAFATGVASHYDGWVVPTIMYTVATGVAAARVNDRKHFASDVLAGALIGHAVAKGVVFRHQHGRYAMSVAPAVFSEGVGVSVHLASGSH